MPLPSGTIPDRDQHRLCRRCRQWHMPEDGSHVLPARFTLMQQATQAARVLGGDDPSHFVCFRCQRYRQRRFQIIVALGALLVVVVLLLERLGILT